MRLAIICSHFGADSLSEAVVSWGGQVPIFIQDGKDGMLPAYQCGFEAAKDYDILAFLHDDLILHDPEWVSRVLKEFEDPCVGLLGFGGALEHGAPELYKASYHYQQLGRSHFLSNMSDAEVHGKRFTSSCRVAVLDGFALIVRSEILEKTHGWPIRELSFGKRTPLAHTYDYWLSCMTRRLEYRIRVLGVACEHRGGRTYVKLGLGNDQANWDQFLKAHDFIAQEFRDVLPFSVLVNR